MAMRTEEIRKTMHRAMGDNPRYLIALEKELGNPAGPQGLVMCKCVPALVTLKKLKAGTVDRYFYGCPRWTAKPEALAIPPCGFFKWAPTPPPPDPNAPPPKVPKKRAPKKAKSPKTPKKSRGGRVDLLRT
jgi:hypothetical protein